VSARQAVEWGAAPLRALGVVGTGLLLALLAEVVFFGLQSDVFFDSVNIANIGRAMAIVGVVAVGQTIVMISGGFDLSVGSVMAASAMVGAYVANEGHPLAVAFAAAVLVGVVVGLANGAIVSYARINALIATLATLAIVRGLAYVVSDAQDLVVDNEQWLEFGTTDVVGVPLIVVFMLAVFALFGAVMPRTRFGRYAYAIGSSSRAARLAGIAVGRWRLAFYVTSGGLAAIAGLMTTARTGGASPSANVGIELDVITAVILGGTSLNGGRGRLFGTFLGLLLIAVLNNGLILIDVEAYWQQVVKGSVLLVAVFWDELRRSRRDES
jgi:ribose transport system permease protein